MSLLLRQVGVLVRKNLLIAFSRKSRSSTIQRCLVAPIIIAVYLCFIFRVYFPKATYGVGSPHNVRNLTTAMQEKSGKRDKLILVNSGPRDGDIDRVIELVAQGPRAGGRNVTITDDENVIRASCRATLVRPPLIGVPS